MRRFLTTLVVLLCCCSGQNGAGPDVIPRGDGGGASASSSGGGGSSGAGSSSGAGASSSGGGGDAEAPPHVVGSCSGLAAAGQWEDISPPGMTEMAPYTGALVVIPDPVTSGTLYVTTSQNGIFKSTDCGATWTKTNTGMNGSELDMGEIWSAQIDPIDPQTLYVLTGYGPSGIWKSTNGGVDWSQILPTDQGMPGFVGRISMDPTDHLHLLVSFHLNCTNGHNPVCFGETKDGGMTWNVIDFPTSLENMWGEGVFLLPIDATHWIYEYWDIFYTADAGNTWKLVTPGGAGAAGSIQGPFFRTSDGTFYLTASFGVITSPDGATWSMIANSATNSDVITGDGTRLYALEGFQPPTGSFVSTAPYAQPSNWSALATPGLPSPPSSGANSAAYDPDHHVLYAAIQGTGLWRTVTATGTGSGGGQVDASIEDAAATDSGAGD